MKRIYLVIIVLFACVFAAFGLDHFLTADRIPQMRPIVQEKEYKEEWRQIDSLTQIRQVQSALALVGTIYTEAHQQSNIPQFIKACLYRINLEDTYEEEATVKMINEMESLVKTAAFPTKNILHSVVGDLYWNYYQQNRWRITSRTAVSAAPDDIRTWDLTRLVAQCVMHYHASLEQPRELQTYSIKQFEAFLEKHPDSEKYRPTLYDFLAFRAVEFYMNNETNLTQPVQRFLMDQADYFQPFPHFLNVKLSTPDSLSFPFQALKLLQQILYLHQPDANLTAAIDADLLRLDLVYAQTVLPEKEALYLQTLQKMDTRYAADYPEASTEILFRIAKLYGQQGDAYDAYTRPSVKNQLKEALAIIEKAVARAPESLGAKNCIALKNKILHPELKVTTDDAVLPNKPILASVQYRNVPKVYFRMIALDYKKELQERETDENRMEAYAKQTALKTWSVELPDDGDYQKHTVELALPEMTEGYYALLSSTDEQFSMESAIVNERKLWVTNLSYVRQITNGEATVLVVHRETGQPIGGVKAQAYTHQYNYNQRRYAVKFEEALTTDTDGIVTLQKATDDHPYDRYVNVYFTQGKDSYADEHGMYLYHYLNDQRESYYSTTFFTDRSIYRPGQTVYFKGLVLQMKSGAEKEAKIAPNYKQRITFYNANQAKVSEMTVTTNEFGSFTGSFIAPATGLTGMMSIRSERANGYLSFRVEEYKRPKFEVQFNPVKGAYRLGEQIRLTGSAKAYAGSTVSEANVTYRVVREARYPYWRWWWAPAPASPSQEITSGTAVTKDDGTFDILFTALPDASVAKSSKPVFNYTIYATVSDINGETHEAITTISVGYEALLISTNMAEEINLDAVEAIEINATSLNNEPQPVKGTLSIWKLREPNRVLQNRRWARPDKFLLSRAAFEKAFPHAVYDNEDNPETWEKTAQVYQCSFDTEKATKYAVKELSTWDQGTYLMELKTKDAFGEAVTTTHLFKGFSVHKKTMPGNVALWCKWPDTALQPGNPLLISIGSACKNVHAILEIVEENKLTKRHVLSLNNEQKTLEFPILEKHRGNIGIQVFLVKDNRSYRTQQVIQVPYDNKKLNIEFATFRDKLQPGQDEEWQITIKDEKGDAATAELLASMYDASLDAFVPHAWNFFPWPANHLSFPWETDHAFGFRESNPLIHNYPQINYGSRHYDQWLHFHYGRNYYEMEEEFAPISAMELKDDGLFEDKAMNKPLSRAVANMEIDQEDYSIKEEVTNTIKTEEQNTEQTVPIRTNFNETAFFYPQLKTNEQGETVISFTIPESLTRWKMQGLAWTQDLKVGHVIKELVTQKDLMIFTNAPRFFRENDDLYFSAKLSNVSEKTMQVKTTVVFSNPLQTTLPHGKTESLPLLLTKGESPSKTLTLHAGENKMVSWKLHIPEGLQAVSYRIIAATLPDGDAGSGFSDGEESTIPVLTNRMLVTESMPLSIRGKQTKKYEFTKLLKNTSKTLKSHSYTVDFTTNPAWDAILALPYMMEYPYECAEQAFSRYYANSIATHIVNSDPKIKQVFDIWRNYQPSALQSNLEKNEALKMLLLEETPWVRAAKNENEQKQRIAVLFDLNRMSNELAAALRKVEQAQTSNGGFAWFKGGPDDRYITQHIVAGIGHLRKMAIPGTATDHMLSRAVQYMDARLTEDFHKLKKQAEKNKTDYKKENHIDDLTIHYLYARSFFVNDFAIPAAAKEAFDFYKTQAEKYWASYNNYMKGMMALAFNRYRDVQTAQLIMKSLSETALHDEEQGMYWRSETNGWWWYQAPIETQALMIEAYDEVLNDQKSVDELKMWLLQQKQTQDWKTTKATSEAVYALLATRSKKGSQAGYDLLNSDQLGEITVGGKTIDPYRDDHTTAPLAGLGSFTSSWKGDEVKPELAKITVTNPNPTIAWGAVYWQYFEQLDKITPAETGVKIKKQLFVKTNTPRGTVLKEIKPDASLKIGDKITVRLEIRSDREMEYVHLKDMRAAAFEPVNVLSGYKWQGGLGYYEATRDAATNFFLSYLPKGTHVFEYELFATQKGEFSNGITALQCMYAPAFTTHSEGIRVRIE